MAYPQTILPIKVEIFISAAWVDITVYVRRANGGRITITRGRLDGQSTAGPSKCRFDLNNRDGRFSPRNAFGPYYGQLTRNTPIRVQVDPGTGYQTRFIGEVASWPVTWDLSGATVWVAVEAAGIMRRLGQGVAKLRSALTRGIADDADLLGGGVVHWSLEDGAEAIEAACDYGTAEPMRPFGAAAPLFAREDGPPGSDRLPDFSGQASLVATIPATIPDTGTWQFEIWFRTATGDSSGFTGCVPIQVDFTGGTIPAFDALLYIGAGAGSLGVGSITLDVATYDATPPGPGTRSGTLRVDTPGGTPNVAGSWRQLSVTLSQFSPGTVVLSASLDGGAVDIGSVSASPWTLGRPSRIAVNPCQGTPGAECYAGVDGLGVQSYGAVTVKAAGSFGITYPAGLGWVGEFVSQRGQRLCDESDVPFSFSGGGATLGPQTVDTLLNLLRDAEAVDSGGILFEERTVAGLRWRPALDLYNQTAVLALVYGTRGHIRPGLPIVDDDQRTRNRVTVQRAGGGRRTVSRDTGPLSTQDPPAGVGVYDETVTLACHTDDDAGRVAGWRVWVGTYDTPRLPAVTVSLLTLAGLPSGAAAMVAAALAVDVGDRLDITGMPVWVPSTAATLVQGYREVIDLVEWEITYTTLPYGPYAVGELDTAWLDTSGSSLAVGVNASATSLTVNVTGPLWTTSGADYPKAIEIGGIRMTLTAVSGASSPQTFTVTRAAADKSHLSGTPVLVVDPLVVVP